MLPVLTDNFGNPSALHAKGVRAKTALETARGRIADALSCAPEEVFFSHSGTLANNTAVFGAAEAKKRQGNRIVTTAVEHPSVAACMARLEERGFEVIRLKPSHNGAFAPEDLLGAVNKNTVLVSCMLVNNETGAINPVELLQKAVKRAGAPALIHVDAIQAFGKMPVRPARLGVDLLTVSGHKIHGPKGVGALYVRKGVSLRPYVLGGGQENGLFSGTEPLPAIVGFGAAAAALPDPRQSPGWRSIPPPTGCPTSSTCPWRASPPRCSSTTSASAASTFPPAPPAKRAGAARCFPSWVCPPPASIPPPASA